MPDRQQRPPLLEGESSAPEAQSRDIARRTRHYLVQMGIRTLCFVLIPFVPGWWKLVVAVGAIFLPYFAVVFANLGKVGLTDPGTTPHPYRAGGLVVPAPTRAPRPPGAIGPSPDVIVQDDDGAQKGDATQHE